MGYIAHDAVIVTASDYVMGTDLEPKVSQWRETLPEKWRALVIGPIVSVVNGYLTWVFTPDGSKSGWADDGDGDRYREEFVALFAFKHEDGSSPFDVVALTYGADHAYEVDGPVARYV